MARAEEISARSRHSGRAVEFLFSRPVFASGHFVSKAGIAKPTALRMLGILREAEILGIV